MLTGVFVGRAHAGALGNISDTLSTSRPSPSSWIASDQAASATYVVMSDNTSTYLASDSAIFLPDSSETYDTANVASMSAANTPSSSQRIVYLTGTIAHKHHQGDAVYVPITAMHKVQFTTSTSLPINGKIIISFPGSGNNAASPSATTFAFNGLNSDTGTKIQVNNASCTIIVSAPTITCTLTAAITTPTVVTFLIGCTAQSSGSCTTQAPTLINPTKTAAGGFGAASATADIWQVNVKTQDDHSVDQDTGKASIGTIESVFVQAHVDPTLTFTISGVANSTAVDATNFTGCPTAGNGDTTNTGIGSTGTVVDMGVLNTANINISAQDISIGTNGTGGYTLTATSSGALQDFSNGYSIASTTTGTTMNPGTEQFGIHACGTDANTGLFGTTKIKYDGGGTGKVAWPTATTSITVASRTSATNGVHTAVEYAGTVAGSTPAGAYQSVITYVATPVFQ
ncbi:MAG: hypothetical protein ACREGI_05475 [Candidatus Levyibacteriota bacterium]